MGSMSDESSSAQVRLLEEARAKGRCATLGAYLRLSGPGWLQSAITLGGGSLASALYLGVLSGYRLLWVQVLAMLFGVVMLAAIGRVTLTTGQRPFGAIRDHINPVLAWGWLLAVLLANIVWTLPQFSLGTAALQQNLVPGIGAGTAVALILGLATVMIWFYDRGSAGVRLFEGLLKALVALIVLCFIGVVVALARRGGGLAWERILAGLVPSPKLFTRPAPEYEPFLAASSVGQWWRASIVSQQRDVMVAAAATAVGINMTFLLPYSMLRKGWGVAHRGLANFDLVTGLFLPFVVATGCVVIASASQFHTRFDAALAEDAAVAMEHDAYLSILDGSLRAGLAPDVYSERSVRPELRAELGEEAFEARLRAVPKADRRLAAMLQKRDAFQLAAALEPLTGKTVAQLVFGLGVLAMAVSTVIILMLISGFAFCEAFGVEPKGTPQRLGALVAGCIGALGPFIWRGEARFYLAVPTSNFGMALLPIAYWVFFLMMNSRSLMGAQRPRGLARWGWNLAMGLAAGIATLASVATIEKKTGTLGLAVAGGFLLLALVVRVAQKERRRPI